MAVKKRSKNRTALARKRSTPREKKAAGNPWKKRLLHFCGLLLLVVTAISATYYFGSFGLRSKIERTAIKSIHLIRSPEIMPRPITRLLNVAYDAIPESRGLVVEGGELGHDESALIAGLPRCKEPILVLHNTSSINLFSERERQARCIALVFDTQEQQKAKIPGSFFEDPRVKQLRASDMLSGQWKPHTIAPSKALARQFGLVGANEACLVTNLAPMTEAFANGLWARLMEELTESYPRRFGQVWVYLGPVMHKKSSKLSTGIPIPDGFFAIAFDLTDTGGLRAIAFLVPQDGTDKKLGHYISSIARIEELTGLKFLPDVDFNAREVLGASVSPQLW
jgi:endonuclease G